MTQKRHLFGAAAGFLLAASMNDPAVAQKQGGILREYMIDSPASMSIHEEGTNSTEIPMMGVFNNLVVYDQHIAQNSLDTIRPELAETWSWSEDGKQLMFKLHQGVKSHDGKPFTSADVKCTFDLLTGRAKERFRANPRKSWWNNVEDIAANGDLEATFVLKRPQPALLTRCRRSPPAQNACGEKGDARYARCRESASAGVPKARQAAAARTRPRRDLRFLGFK